MKITNNLTKLPRRVLSVLLSILMVVTVIPWTAIPAEATAAHDVITQTDAWKTFKEKPGNGTSANKLAVTAWDDETAARFRQLAIALRAYVHAPGGSWSRGALGENNYLGFGSNAGDGYGKYHWGTDSDNNNRDRMNGMNDSNKMPNPYYMAQYTGGGSTELLQVLDAYYTLMERIAIRINGSPTAAEINALMGGSGTTLATVAANQLMASPVSIGWAVYKILGESFLLSEEEINDQRIIDLFGRPYNNDWTLLKTRGTTASGTGNGGNEGITNIPGSGRRTDNGLEGENGWGGALSGFSWLYNTGAWGVGNGTCSSNAAPLSPGAKANWARVSARVVTTTEDLILGNKATYPTLDSIQNINSAQLTAKEFFFDLGAYGLYNSNQWRYFDYMIAADAPTYGTGGRVQNVYNITSGGPGRMRGIGTRDWAMGYGNASLYTDLAAYRNATMRLDGGVYKKWDMASLLTLAGSGALNSLRTQLTNAQNTFASKSYTRENELFEHFGLPTSGELSAVKSMIDLFLQGSTYESVIRYFSNNVPALGPIGKLITTNGGGVFKTVDDTAPTAIDGEYTEVSVSTTFFNTAVADNFDPTSGGTLKKWNGYTLTMLENLLAEASGYYGQFSFLNDLTATQINALTVSSNLNYGNIKAWMTNLQKVINLWKLYEKKAEIEVFLRNLPNPATILSEWQTLPSEEWNASPSTVLGWYNQIKNYAAFLQPYMKYYSGIVYAVYNNVVTPWDSGNTPLTGLPMWQEINNLLTSLQQVVTAASDPAGGLQLLDQQTVLSSGESDYYAYFYNMFVTPITKPLSVGDWYNTLKEALAKQTTMLAGSPSTELQQLATNTINELWGMLAGAINAEVARAMDELGAMGPTGTNRITYYYDASHTKDAIVVNTMGTNGSLNPGSPGGNETAQEKNLGSYVTLADLEHVLNSLKSAGGVYDFLVANGKTGLLTAGVSDQYKFLINAIPEVLEWYTRYPGQFWTAGNKIPVVVRPSRTDDFLEDHVYQDVGSDTYLGQAITKLDNFLGSSGNITPLLKALKSLSPALAKTLEGLGVKIPTNNTVKTIGDVLDEIMMDKLYSDEVVNAVVGMLYPMVLGAFEDIWMNEVAKMQAGTNPDNGEGSFLSWACAGDKNPVYGHFMTLYSRMNEKQTDTTGNAANNFWQLRLYPDMFGRMISGQRLNTDGTEKTGDANRDGANTDPDFQAVALKLREHSRYSTALNQSWDVEKSWRSPWKQNSAGTWHYPSGTTAIDTLRSNASNSTWREYPAYVTTANGYLATDNVERYLPEMFRGETPEHYVKRIGPKIPGDPEAGLNHIYPTNAWSKEVSPNLYRVNPKTGKDEFYLPWGINKLTGQARKDKFMAAMAQVLKGLSPLLGGLLGGKYQEVFTGVIAALWGDLPLGPGTKGKLDMRIKFRATEGFANLLTPIFEAMLGSDSNKTWNQFATTYGAVPAGYTGTNNIIPTTATLQALFPYAEENSGTRMTENTDANMLAFVKYVFGPIDAFIMKMKKAPLTEILKLLPNLAFATSANRIKPLLDSLKLKIDYQAYVVLWHWIGDQGQVGAEGNANVDIMGLVASGGGAIGEILALTNDLGGLISKFLGQQMAFMNQGELATMGTALHTSAEGGDWATRRQQKTMGADYYLQSNSIWMNTRYYVEARPADVLKYLVDWLMRSGMIPPGLLAADTMYDRGSYPGGNYGTGANSAAITHLIASFTELLEPRPNRYAQTTFVAKKPPGATRGAFDYPKWWGEVGQQGTTDPNDYGDGANGRDGSAEAEGDMEYLLENSGAILDIVSQVLAGKNFEALANQLLGNAANLDQAGFEKFVRSIQNMLTKELVQFEGTEDEKTTTLYGMLSDLADLLDNALMTGTIQTTSWTTIKIKTELLDLIKDFDSSSVTVNSPESFVQGIVTFLKPAAPILDWLLAGKDLGILSTQSGSTVPLVELPGFMGYASGLLPILQALSLPLGMTEAAAVTSGGANIINAAGFAAATSEDRLRAIVTSLFNIVQKVLANPADSLLKIVPNLLAFVTEPDGGDSALQRALDGLLQSVYVAVDTLRPLVNIDGLLGDLLGNLSLPAGIALNLNGHLGPVDQGGLRVDVIALIIGILTSSGSDLFDSATGELVLTLLDKDNPVRLDLVSGLIQPLIAAGTWNAGNGYVQGDPAKLLFTLLDKLGILGLVKDYAEFTKLIQYKKLTALAPIDYDKAPDDVSTATSSSPNAAATQIYGNYSWFNSDVSHYLADNVDSVLNYLWKAVVYDVPSVKTLVENLIHDLPTTLEKPDLDVANITVRQTISDTLYNAIGQTAYAQNMLDMVAGIVVDLKDTLTNLFNDIIAALPTSTLASLGIFIGDVTSPAAVAALAAAMAKEPLGDADIASYVARAYKEIDKALEKQEIAAPTQADYDDLLAAMDPEDNSLYAQIKKLVLQDYSGAESYSADAWRAKLIETGVVPQAYDAIDKILNADAAAQEKRLKKYLDQYLDQAYSEINAYRAENPAVSLADIRAELDNDPTDQTLKTRIQRVLLASIANYNNADIHSTKNNSSRWTLADWATALPLLYTDLVEEFSATDYSLQGLAKLVLAGNEALYNAGAASQSGAVWAEAIFNKNVDLAQEEIDAYLEAGLEHTPNLVEADLLKDLNPRDLSLHTIIKRILLKGTTPALGDAVLETELVDAINTAKSSGAIFLDTKNELTLNVLIKRLVAISTDNGSSAPTPIDIDTMIFAPFERYLALRETAQEVAEGGTWTSTADQTEYEAYFEIEGQDDAAARDKVIAALVHLLTPAYPILNFLLSGENLMVLWDGIKQNTAGAGDRGANDPNEAPNQGWPTTTGKATDNAKGLLTFYGYDGYKNGLMPLLLALCADTVPDYETKIRTATAFDNANSEGRLKAIVEPIFALVDQLLKSPSQTLLKLLPNLAYILVDDGSEAKDSSVLQQAINHLLEPVTHLLEFVPSLDTLLSGLLQSILPSGKTLLGMVTDLGIGAEVDAMLAGLTAPGGALSKLIKAGETLKLEDFLIGTITEYSSSYTECGIDKSISPTDPHAYYVDTDMGDLLAILLNKLGVFDMVTENNLAGLMTIISKMLTPGLDLMDGQEAQPINYDKPPTGAALDPALVLSQAPAWFAQAPAGQTVSVAKYLTDNVDAVINYLWKNVVAGDGTNGTQDTQFKQAMTTILTNLYNANKPKVMELLARAQGIDDNLDAYLASLNLDQLTEVEIGNVINTIIKPTLWETVQAVLGDEVYSDRLFSTLMLVVAGLLEGVLGGLDLPLGLDVTDLENFDLGALGITGLSGTIDLLDVIGKIITINGEGLGDSIQSLLNSFLDSATRDDLVDTIEDRGTFFAALYQVIGPIMPILNILLAGSDLDIISDADYTDPDGEVYDPAINQDGKGTNNGKAFMNIKGFGGYESTLLPILMGIGGGVDGFTNTLKSQAEFAAFAAANDTEGEVHALFDPIMFLIERLMKAPVATLLQILPNVAYLISESEDSGASILQQAVNNILVPIEKALELVDSFDILTPDVKNTLDETLTKIKSLNLEKTIDTFLADANIDLTVAELIIGTKTSFGAGLLEVGEINHDHGSGTDDCGAHYIATAGHEDA
ncbi:MAG: hypothetical protein LBG83_03340, partial [Oscillospiraceae bacterium]|nr:hypothetical protein [Oscillospiraceae bacterium]